MVLAQAVESLSRCRSLDEIATIASEMAARLAKADGACFVAWNDDSCRYLRGTGSLVALAGTACPTRGDISSWCVLNRKIAVIPDIAADNRVAPGAFADLRSLIMLPVGSDEPIGAIGVAWAEAGASEAAEVDILEALARAAAAAASTVHRHQSLLRRMDELAALYRLTDSLYRARSLPEIFDAALDAIVEALGSRASILLFDGAGVMRFVAWRGLSEAYRMKLEGHSPWKLGDANPQPIFIEDIDGTEEPEWVKTAIKAEGIHGLAFLPLVAQGRVVGKFMTYYPARHAFPEAEVNLAVTIARQVGFSLERSRAEEARHLAEQELRESEERFRLLSEQAPVMIWTSDATGRCLHLNRLLRTFWGVGDGDLQNFDWQSTMHPEDAPEIGRQMLGAITRKEGVTVDGRYRNADGQYRVLRTDAQPRFSPSGEFLGMIGVNVDITERQQTEKALRESEGRFRLAVEAAPSGMVMTDRFGRITLVNAIAEALFGYARDELIGKRIDVLVPERFRGNHPELREAYIGEAKARPMGAGRDLFALRKDGSEIPVEIGLSPIDTGDGVVVLGAIVDISERKRAEVQRELLLAELNHRVKNTLAIVQGIAHQTFRAGNASSEARHAFEGRLIALATAHNLLTQSNWEDASLEKLAVDALRSQGVDAQRIILQGPNVRLPAKQALAIAMALHELCTNAVKYGSLSNDAGRIEVEWSREEGAVPVLKLVWREFDGPAVAPPERRGFGSRLIEHSLAQDLEGEVAMQFKPEGLVCAIAAPLPAAELRVH